MMTWPKAQELCRRWREMGDPVSLRRAWKLEASFARVRDLPLGEPVRRFEDTFSAETVVMDRFFPGASL